ncbi:hypothetical protein [Ralstonia pseudosolanacearum]|uniref:hypothetical protein n=1 Tax=Ralstonia pseudosolanacearum TaxID=1310165 RepID=UPI001FFBC5E7|nr:hypothetical protein [Ralstonia pseudosolanacearum]
MDELSGDYDLYNLIKLRVDNDLPVYTDGVVPAALDAVIRRIEAETGKLAKVARGGIQYGPTTNDDGFRPCRFCGAFVRDNGDLAAHCCVGGDD